MAEPQANNMSHLPLHSVLLVLFTVTATLAVAPKFWARKIQKLALQTSDYLMIHGPVRLLNPASSPSTEKPKLDLCPSPEFPEPALHVMSFDSWRSFSLIKATDLVLVACCAPLMKPSTQKELAAAEEYGILVRSMSSDLVTISD